EDGAFVRFALSLGVFQDEDAVAFRPAQRQVVERVAVVDRLAHPDAALVVHVHAGRVAKAADLLGGPERQLQPVGVDGEGGEGLVRRDLGGGGGRDEDERGDEKQARRRLHGSRGLHRGGRRWAPASDGKGGFLNSGNAGFLASMGGGAAGVKGED